MAFANPTMSYPRHSRSSRNHFHEPSPVSEQARAVLQTVLRFLYPFYLSVVVQRQWLHDLRRLRPRDLLTIAHLLAVVWVVVVYWGERTLFGRAIEACAWDRWESWPTGALPHHLVFLADPQLVDPHTYPGRPWPLSTLTVKYTDLYLRRSHRLLQTGLEPDSVIFLGDLFDGGREWGTGKSESPEKRWRKYGEKFWMREYRRFHDIFLKTWHVVDASTDERALAQAGRKLITSLPGNHDLGFAGGIQIPVRKRFHAYFGEGNRIDVIANHTFISMDTVSLSAMGLEGVNPDIWKPTQDFLDEIQVKRGEAVARELNRQVGQVTHPQYRHGVLDTGELAQDKLPENFRSDAQLPTILLTHVPLFRNSGTPCGPLREHWPPTPPPPGQKDPVNPDDRNAISVTGGYQYQNVLTPEITNDITSKIGDVAYAFSGDDHDYCEVVHRGYKSAGGGIREITVKSMSWAMGVRKPGFLMVSLWNRIDAQGKPLEGEGKPTLQTHLCLLPDQLSIFIWYAKILVLTISSLVIRAGYLMLNPEKSFLGVSPSVAPILPTSRSRALSSAEAEKAHAGSYGYGYPDPSNTSDLSDSTASTSSNGNHTAAARLSSRSTGRRTDNSSPSSGGYGLSASNSQSYPHQSNGLVQQAGYYGAPRAEYDGHRAREKWQTRPDEQPRRKLRGVALFLAELQAGMKRVAVLVLPFYLWLVWNG